MKKMQLAMIGGGGNAFIAGAHRRALGMIGAEIVAAATHPDPEIAVAEAAKWPGNIRGYGSYLEMLSAEAAKRENGEAPDWITIVTPNHVHFAAAKACLQYGFPVMCEKPLTLTVEEALELQAMVREMKIPFGVAHTYVGHWASAFIRWLVTSGHIGDVRKVISVYWQGWLAGRTEDTGSAQAIWRVDPKFAGLSLCGGDIGTHAFMQCRFCTGLEVKEIKYAKLRTFVEGRLLDDDFFTVCELSNGADAYIAASQIMIGHKNDLGIEICGTKGTIIWRQENPEKVTVIWNGEPDRVYWRGTIGAEMERLGKIPEFLLNLSVLPGGHPEAFHDAYANLYRAFALDVKDYHENRGGPTLGGQLYADINDGVKHMQFVRSAVDSAKDGMAATVDIEALDGAGKQE